MTPGDHHEALVRSGSTLRLSQIPTRLPGPRELLIAPAIVGVCGTDLQILNGSRPDVAEVLGHEGSGVVVHAGAGAAMSVGEHVVFNPAAELHYGRILGHNVPGLFQRYITVSSPSIERGLVMRAPRCDPPACEALVEPLASVIYAYELLSRAVPAMQTVVVFGAGAIGLLAAVYLRTLGIQIAVVHPHRARLDTAIALGLIDASSVILFDETVGERLKAWPRRGLFDAGLICTTRQGAPSALAHAVNVVRDGGCIDLVTNYPESSSAPDGISTSTLRAARSANVCGSPREGHYAQAVVSGRRLGFTGHRGTSAQHLTKALQALQANAQSYARLITHTFELHDAADAIQSLATRERILGGRDCIKAIIDMSGHVASHS